jgi:NADPH-ferrihemoprotein reductase
MEDVKASMSDFGTPNGYHHYAPMMDRSPMVPFPTLMSGLPLQQPCLQYQMMKTPNGYIIQDLEALTQQEPAIPRAVPAMWTNSADLTLAKCLENREGITNVYIRGFLPETNDEMLHGYASRFGDIERCKAIVDLETGLCKGYTPSSLFEFLL